MRYFLDTEFIEDGRTIDLISIGIVCEDGREYYACNDYANLGKASDWVKENVLVHLPSKHIGINPGNPDVSPSVRQEILTWKTPQLIKEDLLMFFAPEAITDDTKTATKKAEQCYSEVEVWADYASYDWIALCQIFGTMMDLPTGFPMYCNDIQQWRRDLGNPDLPQQKGIVHHALHDARHCKELWEFLNVYSEDCVVERSTGLPKNL